MIFIDANSGYRLLTSLLLIGMLSGVVAVILLKSLNSDIARYNRLGGVNQSLYCENPLMTYRKTVQMNQGGNSYTETFSVLRRTLFSSLFLSAMVFS
jgi:hypothetical protein